MTMEFIDLASLQKRSNEIARDYASKTPFHYTQFDGFFRASVLDEIYKNYPDIKDGQWDGTTYIDQKNKFQKTKFDQGSVFDRVFRELNSQPFLKWLEEVTRIRDICGDDDLFGGGLHQSIAGAFLNVHVDYNIHPKTKFHRRLNVLVYMNKNWKEEYEGNLELWDFSNNNKILLAKYPPLLNTCVIFETNEVSFHGHPKPLKTPANVNRKSIATYYYTQTRPEKEMAAEHNTLYVNTEGFKGQVKRFISGVKAFMERVSPK